MANVTFKLDAEEAKAVRSFMRVVDAQKKSERQFGRTVREGKRYDRTMQAAAKSARGFVGTLVGAAGVGMALRATAQQITELTSKNIRFQDSMTELLSLGQNVNNIPAITDQVLGLSQAWGIANTSIIDSMFQLQSGTANLDKTTRDTLLRTALELHKAYGADLPLALAATVKGYQIYRSEGESVVDVQRKLAFLADQGFLTFQDMAQQFPEVAKAAKFAGVSLNELVATLTSATQRGGEVAKTFTAVRNMMLRMANAEKHGIILTGSLVDKLEQLRDVDPKILQKIFELEGVATVKDLIDHVGDLRVALGKIDTDLPDIGRNMETRLGNVGYMVAEQVKQLRQAQENMNVIAGQAFAGERGQMITDWEATLLGAKQRLHPGLQWLAHPLSLSDTALDALFGTQSASKKRGYRTQIEALIKQGRTTEAEALGLTAGQYQVGGRLSTIEDAERFIGLRQKAGGANVWDYLTLQADREGLAENRRQLTRIPNVYAPGFRTRARTRLESERTELQAGAEQRRRYIAERLGIDAQILGREIGAAAAAEIEKGLEKGWKKATEGPVRRIRQPNENAA